MSDDESGTHDPPSPASRMAGNPAQKAEGFRLPRSEVESKSGRHGIDRINYYSICIGV